MEKEGIREITVPTINDLGVLSADSVVIRPLATSAEGQFRREEEEAHGNEDGGR